jgi:hypothetical protein
MNGAVIVTCARSARQKSRSSRNFLMHAEDVVPAAGVEARRVLAQLVEDLVHLERGGMVSISTVALIVPLREAELVLGVTKTSFQRRASRWLSIFGR